MNKWPPLIFLIACIVAPFIIAMQPIQAMFESQKFSSGQVVAVSASIIVAAVGLLIFFKKYK